MKNTETRPTDVGGGQSPKTRSLRPTQTPRDLRPTQTPRDLRPTQTPRDLRPTQTPRVLRPTQTPRGLQPTQSPRSLRPTQSPRGLRPTQTPRGLRQEIQDASDLRKWRTELPNLYDDLGLDVYEFRLLAHYKRVGNCTESVETTASKCRMSTGKVSETRAALAKKWKLITLKPSRFGGYIVRVRDIWERNFAHYSKASARRRQMTSAGAQYIEPLHQVKGGFTTRREASSGEAGLHVVKERKNHAKKEPVKKKPEEQQQATTRAHLPWRALSVKNAGSSTRCARSTVVVANDHDRLSRVDASNHPRADLPAESPAREKISACLRRAGVSEGRNLDRLASTLGEAQAREWADWIPYASRSFRDPVGYLVKTLLRHPNAPVPRDTGARRRRSRGGAEIFECGTDAHAAWIRQRGYACERCGAQPVE